mgnify:CR=1 FL=1|tara:strand:+ start:184 stop:1341 length:1158 start_codon:yes stop_codon:yes gene_type:complete
MKNLFTWVILFILFSCSNNPKIITESSLEELLIEKPKINYKLNSLPKDINVIYFANSDIQKTFPDEVKGLLTSYYSFTKTNTYFPSIRFFNLKDKNSCSLILNGDSFNFIFLLKDQLESQSYDLCLNKFIDQDALVISDFKKNKSIPKSARKFLVSRDEDKYELIKFMNSYSNNIMVIDNETTKDRYEIGEIWIKEFDKKVAEYRTLNKTESIQDIFSTLLLLDQSMKRKRKLSRIISKDLEHKSRTRQDIDTLILSVNTQEARSLKPALDYSYFEGMEVFLINDWREDIQFLGSDQDLENVISIDIPFMLPTTLPDELKNIDNKTRNFAIGYDAFEIVLLMKGARNYNKISYKGLTGKITFRDNDINRRSNIFKIQNGNYEYLN